MLRWIAKAWREDVTKATICNYWAKLTILEKADDLKEPPPPPDLMELLHKCQAVAQVGDDAREPETFLHPKGEDDEPNEQVNLQEIINFHTGKTGLEVVPKEDDAAEPLLSLSDALKALIIVQRFIEHQEDATANNIALLHRIERQFNLWASKACKQSTLNRWITGAGGSLDGA